MILKNISVLYGNNLKFIESTNVKITNQYFEKISTKIKSKDKSIDCEDLLLLPGLIIRRTFQLRCVNCSIAQFSAFTFKAET